MDPLGNDAVRFRHLRNHCEYVAFSVDLPRASAPSLVEGFPHRSFLLRGQQPGSPAARAVWRRPCGLSWAHGFLSVPSGGKSTPRTPFTRGPSILSNRLLD